MEFILLLFSNLWWLCIGAILHLREPADCASRGGYGGRPLMLSRNVCVNISPPVKSLAKSSASLWVFFKKGSNKQDSSSQADTSWNVSDHVVGVPGFIPEPATLKWLQAERHRQCFPSFSGSEKPGPFYQLLRLLWENTKAELDGKLNSSSVSKVCPGVTVGQPRVGPPGTLYLLLVLNPQGTGPLWTDVCLCWSPTEPSHQGLGHSIQ